MLPLVLPFPLSTEFTMKALMSEASAYLDSGSFKASYELYIEALFSAVKELKQLEFNDQCASEKNNNSLSSVFVLAHTCLRQAKSISSRSVIKPPPVPPKPSRLSMIAVNKSVPPPLPTRPSQKKSYSYNTLQMMRTKSKPEFMRKESNLCNMSDVYSDSEDDDEDNDLDDTDDDEGEEEENGIYIVPVVNKGKDPQRKQPQERKTSSSSLKVVTSRPSIKRRSSTSNISNSAPSSPLLSSVTNPLNAVKSFLSLPGSIAVHSDLQAVGRRTIDSSGDDFFLLENGIIDPNILVTVQTSNNNDSLSTHTTHGYLPMIPQAPLVTVYQSLQKQLEDALEQKKKKTSSQHSTTILDIQSSLNRVRNIHMSATTVPTILQFQPVLIAYQLTLIDATIFRNIPMEAILTHAPKTPHPAIVASTDFFNYLTRLIEHAILLQQEASRRAQHINHWIKVAGKCHELKNYQTLKAVISALGTPPIQRLKRSWACIPKKSLNLLEDLAELMSEASNYGKYRERLGLACNHHQDETKLKKCAATSSRKNSFSEPTVPFLGIFIHDMTYLIAALSKKKEQQQKQQQHQEHNSDWQLMKKPTTTDEMMQQDPRVSELLKLFQTLQRSPPYSPTLSPACIKDLNKNRKRKLSHALTRPSSIKKPVYIHEDDGELSIEMQQCLVTQYLLTRSWVSEKTVDELSLVREPTKRSQSVTESTTPQFSNFPPVPPPIATSVSQTTTNSTLGGPRSSSGSLTSAGSTSSNSRPISLEDDLEQESAAAATDSSKKPNTGSFWLFGRKSVDHGYLKGSSQPAVVVESYGTMQRSPRHFSFEELNAVASSTKKHSTISAATFHHHLQQLENSNGSSSFRMHREGSQGSLASSIFRKEFWKSNSNQSQQQPQQQQQQQQHTRLPLMSFHSDPSMVSSIQRKGSTSSSSMIHLSPSTSLTLPQQQSPSKNSSGPQFDNNKAFKHVLTSPHPLDSFSGSTKIEIEVSPQSEVASFNWE